MEPYIPTYTIQNQSGLNLLLRKLAPLERHYYHMDDYLYDGHCFWLKLDSSLNEQELRTEWRQLEEKAKRYAETEDISNTAKRRIIMTNSINIPPALIQQEIFALLVAETQDGELVLRPIGGDYGCNITEAAKELDVQHPGCKMRLYEHNYDSWKRYFEGELPKEQLIL